MTREEELEKVKGMDCSCNNSPTLRAKIISVGTFYCYMEVTPRVYSKDTTQDIFIGKQFSLPTSVAYNMYFN